jgi:ATP-binding cassette subfamily F protein uup
VPHLTLDNVSIRFSQKQILDEVSATIHTGERIALIGRNGEGKTTLMRLLAGMIDCDSGFLHIKSKTTISYLEQSPPVGTEQTLFDCVAQGLGENGKLIVDYQKALNDNDLDKSAKLQQQIDDNHAWDLMHTINTALEKFSLNPNQTLNQLSGGWRRRVMLARALILQPDILLLDEPTNHMDITAILNLEKQLQSYPKAIILISHDRRFVANIAQKIFDLDRGHLSVFDCGYYDYLKRKDEVLNAESLAQKRFDKKLAQEEVWIRQGIKARRTRNEGRVRALKAMRQEMHQRRKVSGKVKIQTSEDTGVISKIIYEVENLNYSIGDLEIVRDFSSIIFKGDKIGIIGGNGTGKSTLIKLLLGELEQNSGKIKRSKTLKIAYFDQNHETLDPKQKAMDYVSGGKDRIDIGGKSKHIIGYLRNFLFTAEQCRSPIMMLSGGEKNRLMLAKILSLESNILVLDEPTNDLDVETLELLEEMLTEYTGTLLLISHDRDFINNVVTSTIILEGDGIIDQYIGNYDDYLNQKQKTLEEKSKVKTPKVKKVINKTTSPIKKKKNDSQINRITKKIEDCEIIIEKLHVDMGAEGFYEQDKKIVDDMLWQLAEKNQELESLWEQLDE